MVSSKPFVFVLMPFAREFDDVYQIGIKPACDQAGAYAERVDEQTYDGNIVQHIYEQISKADIIVADLSGRNPNVFYETGYAHALDKQVILLTKTIEDIPFDLKQYPHIVYEGRLVDLIPKLQNRISWYIDNARGSRAKELHKHVDLQAELLQAGLDSLRLSKERIQSEIDELALLLGKARMLLEGLPAAIDSSITAQKIDPSAGLAVGSTAWIDQNVRDFYQSVLSQDQIAYAANLCGPLDLEEARVLRIVGEDELKEMRLVGYPLWLDWDRNSAPTLRLEAKGLLVLVGSGAYSLTQTGRLATRFLLEIG